MQYCKAKFCVRAKQCKRYKPEADNAMDLNYKVINGEQHCQHYIHTNDQVKQALRRD